MKTHKGAKRRFHITGTGKIMRVKGPKSHLRRNKARRVKKLFDEKIQLHPVDRKRIEKLIPYGVK
jgi:large subunit ribosomal protein L35